MQTVQERATPLLARYGIKKAGLFGSFARGEEQETSDVDILVEPGSRFSLFALAGLQHDLEEAIGRSVDVVTRGGMSPYMRDEILKDLHPIYG
ncbi:MAG: hypothetical protein RL141_409 [Candidatus Parcubacteria bacterium]